MQVYVLFNGVLKGGKQGMLASAGPDEQAVLPVYTVLIKHPDGYVLYDAACHDEKARQDPFIFDSLHLKDEERLLNRLAEIGVAPEEIKYVVLSHMHADHAGYIELFPNAEICVSENEFTYSIKDYALGISKSEGDIAFWIERKLNWKLLPDEEKTIKLLDGVTIYNFGRGHSYGMLGLLIDLPKTGKVLLVSDAVYLLENLGPPRQLPGMVLDGDGYLKTLDYIDKLAKDLNAAIWFGHDIEQNDTLIKSTEGYYE